MKRRTPVGLQMFSLRVERVGGVEYYLIEQEGSRLTHGTQAAPLSRR